jgi:hypothetical protein
MKDNKQWDNVHRTLKAQTCYQDVDDVLNPTYAPQTTQDIELFAEKQKYMYSVLERILQNDEGKVIVRSHDADRDAQLIYSEFLQVMTKSTEAMMDSGNRRTESEFQRVPACKKDTRFGSSLLAAISCSGSQRFRREN